MVNGLKQMYLLYRHYTDVNGYLFLFFFYIINLFNLETVEFLESV